VLAAVAAGTSFFYTLLSVGLVGLLLLSALLAGAEAAFFSLSTTDLHGYRTSRFPADRLAARLLQRPKRLLATILITRCLVNVAIVVLAASLTWSLTGTARITGWLLVVITLVVSFAIVFFGEVLPKVYAGEKRHPFVRNVAYLLVGANALLRPLSWLLVRTTQFVEGYIQHKGYKITVDELNQTLEVRTGANTTSDEQVILRGLVNFGTIAARQIMQPRVDVTAVSADLTFHELMDRINKSGYSRIPCTPTPSTRSRASLHQGPAALPRRKRDVRVAEADPAPVFHSRKQEDRRPAARIPVAARAHGRGGGRVRRHVGHRHAGRHY
jgi:CBS domain containing-hemolysin-like protein